MRFTLPDGREAEAYEIKGRQVRDLTSSDNKGKKSETTLYKLLKQKLKVMGSNGDFIEYDPYASLDPCNNEGLIALRRVTISDIFKFPIKCGGCGETDTCEIDLSDDEFNIKQIKWKDENNPDGVDKDDYTYVIEYDFKDEIAKTYNRVVYKIMTGKDTVKSKAADYVSILASKAVGFEKNIDKKGNREIAALPPNFFDDIMGWKDLQYTQEKILEYEGGVKKTLDHECSKCGYLNEEIAIPFMGSLFFQAKYGK